MPAAMVDQSPAAIRLRMQVFTDQTWAMLWPIPAVALREELDSRIIQDQQDMVEQTLKVAQVVMWCLT
jgi:hypothetical protein